MTADVRKINADLHCHSRYSDGQLEPAELVRRARANGVELLALTDHDELDGIDEAIAAAADIGLPFVPGVEVSVTWGGETVHIVGLRVDHRHPELVAGVERTRAGRDLRAREMGMALAAVGIPDAYEGALRHVGNPALVSRTHFARHLFERGVCRQVSDVFRRFLVEGKPGFVPHSWARLDDAVGWIRAAGGVAVLAHPGRYRLGAVARRALLEEFRGAGGAALEVLSASHDASQSRELARSAEALGMMASRGSDFHAPSESRVELGALPDLPAEVTPVWHDWPEARLAAELKLGAPPGVASRS